MSRPEYVTCILGHKDSSLCGLPVQPMFYFQSWEHAQASVAGGSRLTICPECEEALIRVALQAAVEALRIAGDWNVDRVQIETVPYGVETDSEGFVETSDLAAYLSNLAVHLTIDPEEA